MEASPSLSSGQTANRRESAGPRASRSSGCGAADRGGGGICFVVREANWSGAGAASVPWNGNPKQSMAGIQCQLGRGGEALEVKAEDEDEDDYYEANAQFRKG